MKIRVGQQAAPEPDTTVLRRFLVFLVERLTVATCAALLSVWLFASFSAEINDRGRLVTFDERVLAFCAAHQYPLLHRFAWAVSWISNPTLQVIVVGVAVAVFASRQRFWPQGVSLLLAMFVGQGVVSGLKYVFQRPRPEEIYASLGYSFPSGHTFTAVVVYGMLAYWVARELPRRRRPIAWAVGIMGMVLVGASRIYLGEHFPSDVGAGFAAAIAWLWLCLSVTPLLRRKALSPGEMP